MRHYLQAEKKKTPKRKQQQQLLLITVLNTSAGMPQASAHISFIISSTITSSESLFVQ